MEEEVPSVSQFLKYQDLLSERGIQKSARKSVKVKREENAMHLEVGSFAKALQYTRI